MWSSYQQQLKKQGELYLRIKARPRAGRTELRQIMADGALKIDIAALPIKNQANQALLKFLAQELSVKTNNVKIIAGQGEPVKLVKITT